LETLVEDGVRWVEMRGMNKNFRLEGEDISKENRLELVRVIDEEVGKFMGSEKGRGFWGARMIWDTLRSFDTEAVIEGMNFQLLGRKMAHVCKT
jgi:adenosine deaminase CECR1